MRSRTSSSSPHNAKIALHIALFWKWVCNTFRRAVGGSQEGKNGQFSLFQPFNWLIISQSHLSRCGKFSLLRNARPKYYILTCWYRCFYGTQKIMSQMLKFRLIFLTRYQRSTKGHLFCLCIRNQPEEQTTIWYHQSLVQSHSISKWRFSLVTGAYVPSKPILRVGSSSHMSDFTAQWLAHRSAYSAFVADGFWARSAGR